MSIEFDPNDVITVAKAVLSVPLKFDNSSRCGSTWCIFCNTVMYGADYSHKDFEHEPTCARKIAQDLLTRTNEL